MKKGMRQLTTVNSTLLFKYTCTVCMWHEEIHVHAQKWNMYKHICYHIYIVQSIGFSSCGCTETCSNKYGILRRKVASSPGSPPHEHTLILNLCTRKNTMYMTGVRLAMPGLNTRVGVFTSP